ncbi:MAG: hypothetical protein LBS70_07940 [Candidatus Accumulibacter sp.]|jgi:TolB-like protein|nr:hypothetical protein [Accumulibacter sp.]
MRALKLLPALALAAAGLLASGCETVGARYEDAANSALLRANYTAIDRLMGLQPAPASASNQPAKPSGLSVLVVATVANIDSLERSSTLGRVISEHWASRLTQNGYKVVELKVRNSVYMKQSEGEFLLTREIKEVAAAHDASGVIVGVYGESSASVYVTLKLVDPTNSLVLASHDYALPLTREVDSMLRRK